MLKRLFIRKSIDALVKESEQKVGLKRTLGPLSLTAFGIGAIIGAGIFVLTGQAAAQYAGPGITLSFIIAAVICLFCALCYAEFAALIPIAGSAYSYAYATLGELAAWVIGWALTVEYIASPSTVAVGWSGYATSLLSDMGIHIPAFFSTSPFDYTQAEGWKLSGSLINLPAMFIVFLLGALNALGIKLASEVNNALVVIKLSVILLFLAVGIAFVTADNWHPFIPDNLGSFGSFGWSGIFRGAAVVFFAFLGFDALSTLAQETKKPQRDLPIGMLGSLAISSVVYIVMALVVTGIVSYTMLDVPDPVAVAVNALGSGYLWLRIVVKIGILAGLTSVILVMMLCQARIFSIMATDGLIPKKFASIHPRFRTPFFNTVLITCVVATMAGLFPVTILGELTSMGTLLVFMIVCLGVLILRRSHPKLHRPFRAPWSPYVPAIGGICCFGLMLSLSLTTWVQLIAWLVVGTIIYFTYGIKHSNVRHAAHIK